jgi:hypothetical protein
VAELHNYCCFRRWYEANSMTSSTCTSRHQWLWLTGLDPRWSATSYFHTNHVARRQRLDQRPTPASRSSARTASSTTAHGKQQHIVAPATLPPTLRSPSAFAFTVYFAVAGLGRWAMAVGLGDARQGCLQCLDAGIAKNRRGRERKQGEMGLEGGKTWVTMQNCMPCCHAMSAKEC